MQLLARLVLTIVAMMMVAGTARAQRMRAEDAAPRHGWTMTPSMTVSEAWDDNALVQGNADSPITDQVSTLSPGASIDYSGRKSDVSLAYTGNYSLYQTLRSLNAFEHTQRFSTRRRLSRQTFISASQSLSISPTTDTPLLIGVPFLRLGSRIANAGAGIDTTLSKRTSLSALYTFQWIRFAEDPLLSRGVVGGQSHGGHLGARRTLSKSLTMTADYDAMRADIVSGGTFSVQNASIGAEYRLSERSRMFGTVGVARLNTLDFERPRMLPSWRTGVRRQFQPAGVEVTYGRTFVPSYAGGGTQSNQELTARVYWPLGRRAYSSASLAWRRDVVIAVNDLPLTSVWLSGTVGYSFRPWMHLEGFYSGLSQRIDRPGGDLDRHRAGIQLVTGIPVRMR